MKIHVIDHCSSEFGFRGIKTYEKDKEDIKDYENSLNLYEEVLAEEEPIKTVELTSREADKLLEDIYMEFDVQDFVITV